jgi:hypothetical protein
VKTIISSCCRRRSSKTSFYLRSYRCSESIAPSAANVICGHYRHYVHNGQTHSDERFCIIKETHASAFVFPFSGVHCLVSTATIYELSAHSSVSLTVDSLVIRSHYRRRAINDNLNCLCLSAWLVLAERDRENKQTLEGLTGNNGGRPRRRKDRPRQI